MDPERTPTPMAETPDARLGNFARRLDAEPTLGFLRELRETFSGAATYVVGGIVRDVMLGKEAQAKDYDVVVSGVPAGALEPFLADRGTIHLVGRNFGVFKFRPHGWPDDCEDIDVALPRREFAEGTGGSRDFDVQADHTLPIEHDLSRRDFTMNAMAWDIARRTLVDPFDGRGDLKRKRIRAVGDANERFTEDRSRMLRALRFAAQLGFDIEPETMQAIRALIPTINEQRPTQKAHEQTTLIANTEFVTPRETIAKELIKSFVADPTRSMDLWDDAGAIRELMPEALAMKGCEQPEIYHSEGDVWTHTRLALAKLRSPEYRAEFGDEEPGLVAGDTPAPPLDAPHAVGQSPSSAFGASIALVVLGVFFHDFGKPPTKKTPERDGTDRVRFDGHDKVGGEMVRTIARRLALASPFPKGHRLHVDPEDLGLVVDHHLLLLQDPGTMKNATIEKYFFNPNKPGDALQRVSFCDGSAAIPLGEREPDLAHFRALRERMREIAAIVAERNRLPKPVINGNDIMGHYGLAPGKRIGELIAELREEQLRMLTAEQHDMTPDEAYAFLAKLVESQND